MNKFTFKVKGMHCRSCEVLLEKNIKNVDGVFKVKASTAKQEILVSAEDKVNKNDINKVIEDLGYSLGQGDMPFFSQKGDDYKNLFTALLLLISAYLVYSALGLDNVLTSTSTSNLSVVFLVGLTAGVSSCMALVGGLVLAISARHAEKHPNAATIQKFRPHLFFNLGRVLGFFVLGGLMGLVGSTLKLSATSLGAITLVVGFVMLLLGLQLIEIFPKLSSITLPKTLTKLFKIDNKENKEYSHINSLVLGALTFFLPCGFTQAMQVLAISSGSFLRGALIMGVFALGTTPGLVGIGGIVSSMKKGLVSNIFFKFVGLLLIALSLYNISNGLNLTGIKTAVANTFQSSSSDDSSTQSNENDSTGPVRGETQVLKATYSASEVIQPTSFNVKAKVPVRLEILAKDDGSGCMGSVMIPGLVNQPEFFVKGETVVMEFTPPRTGTYKITCAMGIPAATIKVN